LYLSPNKFIFHFHRVAGSHYHHPDAANFNSWRRHLSLDYASPPEELVHAWEDVKAMFNGGSRKRLSSPTPTGGGGGGGAKSRAIETASSSSSMTRGTERRQDECAVGDVGGVGGGAAKRQRLTTAVETRGASIVKPPDHASRPPGFYLPPSSYPAVTRPNAASIANCSHHSPVQCHPPSFTSAAPHPSSTSIQTGSAPPPPYLPYYDVLRMQMLAAAAAAANGDMWKAVCPLSPPVNMAWPASCTFPPAANFPTAAGGGRPRNALERFLALSPSVQYRHLARQRALMSFDAVQPVLEARAGLGPLPVNKRKPYSAFRIITDAERHPIGGGATEHEDTTGHDVISDIDDDSGHRLDLDTASRCANVVSVPCENQLTKNETYFFADIEERPSEVINIALYL